MGSPEQPLLSNFNRNKRARIRFAASRVSLGVLNQRRAPFMDTPLHIVSLTSFAALLVACASSPYPAAPTVSPSLQAPAGSTLYLETLASGVQIYECSRKPDSTYEWAFKAPEATLTARSGQPLGKHYAGPTWEALDGSTTVGEVKAREPAPSPSAIPWLLLAAKSNSGRRHLRRRQVRPARRHGRRCGPDRRLQ